MGMEEKKGAVIETLAKHEEAIARLYGAYSEAFPDRRDFWSSLAAEEIEHAAWLRNLIPQIEKGSVYFEERRFQVEAIRTSQGYLEQLAAGVRKEKPPVMKALSEALDIERALIERGYFQVAKTDSLPLREAFENLADGTIAHIERVQRAWAESKAASCARKKPEE